MPPQRKYTNNDIYTDNYQKTEIKYTYTVGIQKQKGIFVPYLPIHVT